MEHGRRRRYCHCRRYGLLARQGGLRHRKGVPGDSQRTLEVRGCVQLAVARFFRRLLRVMHTAQSQRGVSITPEIGPFTFAKLHGLKIAHFPLPNDRDPKEGMPGDVAAIEAIEHTINQQGLPSPFRIRRNPILMISCIALRIGSIMVTDKPRRSYIRDGWAVTGCQQIIRAQKDFVCHEFNYIPSRTRESEMWQRNLGTLQDQQIESLWKRRSSPTRFFVPLLV